jgi:branched-chain amino acid aminotransferase
MEDAVMSNPEILKDRIAYVNGEFVPVSEARISILDRGFLYGDGLYETLNLVNGKTFRLDEHLRRLFRSAAVLKIKVPLPLDRLRGAVWETIKRNSLTDAYVRILLSRGESFPIIDTRAVTRDATLVILVHTRDQPPEVASYFAGTGLHARIVGTRKIPPEALDPRVKSLNYLNSVLARAEAVEAGADEAILLDAHGFVAEGSGSNIFAVHGSTLVTPPVTHILVGVTRGAVIDVARARGMEVVERNMTPYDLYTADEIFLTSTYGGLTPVTQIDGRIVGEAGPAPGAVASALKAAYQELLASEGDDAPA